jgi:hypothetical protein
MPVLKSPAPRIPRIPARGTVPRIPTERTRWYHVTPLGALVIAALLIVGGTLAVLYRVL